MRSTLSVTSWETFSNGCCFIKRLVYSPKIYAYIKTDATRAKSADSYIDLSDFISSGQVSRVTGAASTFTLTLRNPYRLWTQPDPATAPLYESLVPVMPQILQSPFEPVFHPMDTITIWGSRFKDKPIQLFTGFLDSSPYLQLYPGAVTLTGSCTLKRLLYTYWDPGLTAILSWLYSYGWIPNPQTGQVTNQGAATTALNKANNFQLNDGSVANLVYGLLHDIGNWDDDEILIEGLPKGIVQAVQNIYKIIQQDNQLATTELQTFLSTALGAGGYGSGSGGPAGPAGLTASGSVSGAKQIVQTIQPIAAQYNVPLLMVLAVMYIENNYTGNSTANDTPGSSYQGWFQQNDQTAAPYSYGTMSGSTPTSAEVHDLGTACLGFCSAAAGYAKANPGITSNIQQWAMTTQGVNFQNNPGYGTRWPAAIATSQSYINQFASSTTTGASGGSPVTTSTGGNLNNPSVRQAVTKPGAKNPSAGNANTNGVINPIPGWTIGREDMGVDATAPAGTAVLAPADCTYVPPPIGGWYPSLYLFKFDNTPVGAPCDYWYVAEGVTPPTGTHFKQGDVVCGSDPSLPTASIEIGWGSATNNTRTLDGGANAHPPAGATTPYGSSFKNFFSIGGGSPQQVSGGTPGTNSSSVANGNVASTGTAAAFAVSLALPGLADQEAAALLVGEKSLMNCTSIFPFVQQVTSASLRTFQSLPDGTFFAFFPDYFGEFAKLEGVPGAYWSVPDIEILDGQIQLSDDALATHVYVVGDTIGAFGQSADGELINEIMSGGVMTIFEAFECGFVNLGTGQNPQLTGKVDAINFLSRYGARPYINEDASFIRSPMFEAFMAFQTFQLMWARQFQTSFSFTFMPEMYPGGRIELSDHGIQVYVDSVTHNFDYVQGFTTDAQLEAPSAMDGIVDNVGISKGMIRGDLLTLTPTKPTPTTSLAGKAT